MNEVRLLETWFIKHARSLPWRETTDPYAIWISEIMLQQTQVSVVIPYYERFLSQFPTIEKLSRASEQEVLALWSGLGYYSRGKNLRYGARYIVNDLKTVFPKTRDEILKVPGIGPYTAGAILSIAFDLPVPLVDGNVQRVFSRFFGFKKAIESSAAKLFFWKKATEWVKDARSPRHLNQALMELGATLCTKADPKCGLCPLKTNCKANLLGVQRKLPKRKPRRKSIPLHWVGLVMESKGKFFLQQNKAGSWWAGMWDLPRLEVKNRTEMVDALPVLLKKYPKAICRKLNLQKHTVTHHKLLFAPYHLRIQSPKRSSSGTWFQRDKLETLPISSLVRKTLASL